MHTIIQSSNFLIAFSLALLWIVESYWPDAVGRQPRWRHAGRNLTLGIVNALLSVLFAALLLTAAAEAKVGLLHWLPTASYTTVLALVLQDAWMYAWHRANHTVPLLWRFHRVHHSDAEMDVTSAIRFHPGEIVISGCLRAGVVLVLGLSLPQVLLYDALLLPVIFFHHSNIRLPEQVDRVLRLVITTPALHRVHHSRLRYECDSNYGSIFSWWDRLWQTFRLRHDGTPVDFGVDGWDRAEQQSLRGLLQTPFTTESSATTTWLPVAPAPANSPKPH